MLAISSKTIWTIGHSTHSWESFTELLFGTGITLLVDVRHYPGSKRFPQFNKEHMQEALPKININYLHLVDLGGRRKPAPNSPNTAWRNAAFRGYADYIETTPFKEAVVALEKNAALQPTAYMCSEAVWWSCHRALLSDYLKASGWTVMHIMPNQKPKEHPYTAPARIVDGILTYTEPRLF